MKFTPIPGQVSRRKFLIAGATASLGLSSIELAAKSLGENRKLLKPVHDQVVCPWSPQHPRHDHQLIFPLDDERLLLVWSEYYSRQKNPQSQIGQSGIGDAVSCQISSMLSRDRGRTWTDRKSSNPAVPIRQQINILRWNVPKEKKLCLQCELRVLGIRWDTLFADLDHVAKDIMQTAWIDLVF